jgi:hypothetical protein
MFTTNQENSLQRTYKRVFTGIYSVFKMNKSPENSLIESENMLLLSSRYLIEKPRLSSSILLVSNELKHHPEIQDRLVTSSMHMMNTIVPAMDNSFKTPFQAVQELDVLSLTCFWIVCKFNIDHFQESYYILQEMTNIPWLRFTTAESEILKILDYRLLEFMEDPVDSILLSEGDVI